MTAAAIAAASGARAARSSTADFLAIPVGGRAAAMGGAYSALADDAFAPVWNPAGLNEVQSPQLAAMHLDYAGAIGYEYAAFARPLGAGGVGVSAQYLHPKAETRRDAAGSDTGRFTSHFGAYALSYGRSFGPVALGASVKLVDARVEEWTDRSAGADAGARWKATPRLTVAFVSANAGTGSEAHRLGAAFAATQSADFTVEGVHEPGEDFCGRAGAEWRPLPAAALRAGYRSDLDGIPGLSGISLGAGLKWLGQRFDYAWTPMGDLGSTQYFSVLFQFGEGEKR